MRNSTGNLEPGAAHREWLAGGSPEIAGEEPFDSEPEATLRAIAAYDGPVLVDLDETLYLRNSTEDFIDQARPGIIALLLLRVLDFLEPWRWLGGEPTRDIWRVQLVRLLFPWTTLRWRARTPALAQKFANLPLLHALRNKQSTTFIVTAGFQPIVAPLVAALGLPDVRIVASRLDTFADRRRGKLECVNEALGEATVHLSLVVTDSLQDLPLLRECAVPLRTLWPRAKYRPALCEVYLPGQYLAVIKRPGEHYFRRAVLQEDYVLWVLSSLALAGSPFFHAAGLLLLLLSFWVIYEIGYVDNDQIAKHREEHPTLTDAFNETSVATPRWLPWIWATALGLAGIWVFNRSTDQILKYAAIWAATLIGTHVWFMLYNRAVKPVRVWMYAGLQLARNAAFVVLVPVTPVGAMALAANVHSRWLQYYFYRVRGTSWSQTPHVGLMRILLFVSLALLLGLGEGWHVIGNWTTVALLGWTVFRARNELTSLFSSFVWLKRTERSEPVK